jgi:S1-C subfamily serine protease
MKGGKDISEFNKVEIRDICKCSAKKIPEKYSSLKNYMSSVIDGSQSGEVEAASECALEILNVRNQDSSWKFPKSFKALFNSQCEKGFLNDNKFMAIIEGLDFTALDICNCSIGKIQKNYDSLNEFIYAKNQKEVGAEAGFECVSELVSSDTPIVKGKENKVKGSWKLKGKYRTAMYNGCIQAGIKEPELIEIINALGFDEDDFCACTVNKAPEEFDSLSDMLSSVKDKSDKRIEKVGENCMLDLMSSNNSVDKYQSKESSSVTGSGFFISKNNIVTNNHVVDNCQEITIQINNKKIPAHIITKNKNNDLAVLSIGVSADNLTHGVAKFRFGKKVRVGDDVVVIGYPLGSLLGRGIKATKGNVSSLSGLSDDITQMQITAPVQSGNSGGPLLDLSGNIVGVVTAKLDALEVNKIANDLPQNVNFSIKSSVVESFLDANDIGYKTRRSINKIEASNIVQEAKKFTVKVYCAQ